MTLLILVGPILPYVQPAVEPNDAAPRMPSHRLFHSRFNPCSTASANAIQICCQFDFARLSGFKYSCPWRKAPVAIHSCVDLSKKETRVL